MLNEGYRVTLEHQGSHWWYRSRRDLFLRQVRRAARSLGHPEHRLALLDYGCASGFDLPFLAEFGAPEGADVGADIGVDSDAEMGAKAHDDPHARASAFRIHVVPRDLPALCGRFHVVTCLDVLEHLDDDVEGLRTLRSLLVPGGQAVVTVPAYRWLWSGEDEISQHRRRYTRRSLLASCRSAGMDVLYASYFNLSLLPPMAAVVWTRRLFHQGWRGESNLTATSGPFDRLWRAATALEARWVGDQWSSLPAGASLVCRLRRAEDA
jgi:2-polyprenyl-3-methyl-5-hydroxy-6-metoxy-1,4-benzoquinol methylase